jgi:ABC-type bacteriocin transporter
MKKGTVIKQHDITDCGAACLASVAAHYELNFPVSRIRQYASTDKKGTNVLGMIEAAEKLGFAAKGVKGPFESLFKIPKPAIAHVVINEKLQHFVVIYKINKEFVFIMDPAHGKILKKSHDEFRKEWTNVLILLVPNDEFQKGNEKTSTGKRFFYLIKPHRTIMTQALAGAIVYSILGLSTAIYVQKIVDYVLVDGNLKLLHLMSVIMIFLLIMKIFIGSMKSVFVLKTGQKIDATLILGYYKHLMKLPQQFFDTMRVGEIISRIGDAVKIRNFINEISLDLVVNIMIVVFTITLMFVFSWQLTLITLIAIPLFGIIYYIYNSINRKYLRKIMENAADLESQLVESLNAMGTIKQFGLEVHANFKTENRFIKLLYSTFYSAKYSIISSNTSALVSGLITIVILWFGAHSVVQQKMTPGELMSFYALIGYILAPVSFIISSNQNIQNALIAADRLFQIMDLEREEEIKDKIELKPEMIENIHFHNVSFRYGSRVQVFEDLSLIIEKNTLTAIVGESGSGKTTLVSLLQNIYPVQKGNICIGDMDLKHISTDSLRKLISVVPQKIDLFAGSVIDNIAVGDYELDMNKMLDICRKLNLIKFIEKLPKGFYTYIGENGINLSGGEKQRIAIARALYKDPEILILDEATSSLDSASEQYVHDAIQYLISRQKTIIVIAHRLSTVMRADKIILLKNGKLVEQGTHQELYAKKDGYFKLWQQQLPMIEEFKLN